MAKQDLSYTTISTEAVFFISSIESKERRNVATFDIPGAFLKTNLDGEEIIIRLEGKMAELLVMIYPQLFRSYFTVEQCKTVLYAELRKAIYGILQIALKISDQITQDLTKRSIESLYYNSEVFIFVGMSRCNFLYQNHCPRGEIWAENQIVP